MAFTDLPPQWADRPIHHPALVADVLDLLVPLSDRRAGALLLALCDEQGRLLQPCLVEGDPGCAEARRAPGFFAEVLAGLRPGGSMLVGIARSTGLLGAAHRPGVRRRLAGRLRRARPAAARRPRGDP